MKIYNPNYVNVVSDELKLQKTPKIICETLSTLVEYKYAIDKTKKIEPRFSCLNSSRQLTNEEEKHERFAEEVAKMFGLAYFPESCIAAKENQFDLLKKAYDIISLEMDTDPIQDEVCNDTYKKKFVFYS